MAAPPAKWHPNEGDALQNRWECTKKLGAGASGAVYEVIEKTTGDPAACKVEHTGALIRALKGEVGSMRKLTKAGATHCTQYLDAGRGPKGDYIFLCLTMVGQNLEKLRENLPKASGGRFTLPTCLHIGMETLEGLRELHDAGYLHRDVKPENFAIGRSAEMRRVYLLDLAMVRAWRRSDGTPHRAREQAAFRGSLKLASANALRQQEQSRADDLWAWFYMQIELTINAFPWPSNFPGNIYEKMKACAEAKEKANRDTGRLLRNAPREYQQLHSNRMTLRYESDPDYESMLETLRGIVKRKGYTPETKLDWEAGGQYFEEMRMVPYDNRC